MLPEEEAQVFYIPERNDEGNTNTDLSKNQTGSKSEHEVSNSNQQTDQVSTTTTQERTPNTKPKKSKTPNPLSKHPAIVAYHEIVKRWPNQAVYVDIVKPFGDNPTDDKIELWRKIVHDWIAFGWNPSNIAGMLQAFVRGGIALRDTRVPPVPNKQYEGEEPNYAYLGR